MAAKKLPSGMVKRGDTDGSGTFDTGDIAAFNALLPAASAASVPEPSAFPLALFALAGVAGRRRAR